MRTARQEPRDWPTRPADRSVDPSGALILSAFAHLLAFTLVAFALGHRPRASGAGAKVTREQLVTMQRLIAASDARELTLGLVSTARSPGLPPFPSPSPPISGGRAGEGGQTAKDERKEPNVGKETARSDAATFGMVGLLQALKVDPGEPTPWKNAFAGLDAHAAGTHALFDDPAPQAWGVGGLTLSSTGEGVGGKGAGIELTAPTIESLPPPPDHPLPPRSSHFAVHFRGAIAAEGGLGEDSIRRVVHASGGRFRECYADGLRRNPALAGRVVVAFTIGAGGDVTVAHDEGSDLADDAVRSCIVARFFTLRFSPPKGGSFSGNYPFALKPDE